MRTQLCQWAVNVLKWLHVACAAHEVIAAWELLLVGRILGLRIDSGYPLKNLTLILCI